jgi:hypothetical protein
MPLSLEERFHKAMVNIYETAKDECDYNATHFIQMVAKHGGVETARRLLRGREPQYGFTALWDCGRLDLTVEAHVLKPEFTELFTDEERSVARQRLEDYGYEFR